MTVTGKKVLVTGADGFIGSELCRRLSVAGYSLIRFSRSHSPRSNDLSTGNTLATEGFSGDIRDRELLQRALTGVQSVFHLAGIAHVDGPEQALLQAVNVEGAANLVAAARDAGVEKIIYFSSSLAAAAEQDQPYQTAYGRSKWLAEQRLQAGAGAASPEVVILRPVNVYGPGMKGNLAALIRYIARGRLPPLPRLDTRLSLVGLHDLCRAALAAEESEVASGRTYTVTDGEVYRLTAIEKAIYQAVGRKKPGWHSPRALYYLAAAGAGLLNRSGLMSTSLGLRSYGNLVRDNVFSNRQICEELGFIPEQTFYTALPELVNVK